VAFLLGADFETWPHPDFDRRCSGKLLPFRGTKASSSGTGCSASRTTFGIAARGIAVISPP
jgi:hypothetical protein